MKKYFGKKMIITMVITLSVVSCKKDKPNPPYSNGGGDEPVTNQVFMQGSQFSPASITVSKGATVVWENDDNTSHTVTSNTNVFESGDLSSGKTFSYTFSMTGTYPYYCRHHSGMTGTVTVK